MKVMTNKKRSLENQTDENKQKQNIINPCIKFVITLVRINHFSPEWTLQKTKLISRAYVGCADKVSFSEPRLNVFYTEIYIGRRSWIIVKANNHR